MSRLDPPSDPPADLAAEYALGVLDADAHRAAEARALSDPAFAADALAWSERLSPLLDEIGDAEPSPAVWPRIAGKLVSHAEDEASGVTFLSSAARRKAPDGETLRRRVSAWRTTALSALAASLVLAVALGLTVSRPTTQPSPMLVARLAPESGGAPLLAAYDPGRRAVLVGLAGADTPSGRSPELWLIDTGGKPHAIGLLRSGDVVTLTLPAELVAHLQGGTLAISIEPTGGSPTGLPTGPVIAKGSLSPA